MIAQRFGFGLTQFANGGITGGEGGLLSDVWEHVRGAVTLGWEFLSTTDQMGAFRKDLERLRGCELLPPDVEVGAFIFDVRSGALDPVDPEAG